MASGIFAFNVDLSSLFVAGSSPGVVTGYKLSSGQDIATIFSPYVTGKSKSYATGILTSSGEDISDLFSCKSFPLIVYSGCCLWLDAADTTTITKNDTKVSQWNDKSPNNYHMLQTVTDNQPTYDTVNKINGLPTLSFTKLLQNYLYGNTAANNFGVGYNSYAIFIVCYYPNNLLGSLYSKSLYGAQSGRIIINRDTTGTSLLFTKTDPTNHSSPISDTYTGTYRIIELIINRNQGIDTSYQNGTLLQNYTYASDITTNYPSTNTMLIGAYNNSSGLSNPPQAGYYLNGNVAEIVSFSNPFDMTDVTRQKMEGYLAWKWGLKTTLPEGHPYRLSAPTPI